MLSGSQSASGYRNVLLIIADDWSPIAGCYDHPIIQTPNIDQLASEGVRFDNAFCTTPSCAASRANVLTGLYSHTHGQYGHCHGVHGFRTHEWVPSVPRVLKESGYSTGGIGKLHVMPEHVYPWDFTAPADVGSVAQGVRRFFEQCGDRPFYLHVGFWEPHRDFGINQVHPEESIVEYDPDEVIVPPFLPDCREVREELAYYYQAISRLDYGVGQVLGALREAGREKDTLIICMSDHGMPFPGAKGSSFDSGHHCPLIISHPELKRRGIANDAMVNWSNIAPTVYEWCGVSPPEGLPERSLLPILEHEHPQGWDETFYSHSFHEVTNYYPYRVLRGRKYKYVLNLFPELTVPLPSDLWRSATWRAVQREGKTMMGERPTERFLHHDGEELFDIESDPVETKNLIDEPELADVVQSMRAKMQAFRRRTKDPWIAASIQKGEVFPDESY